MPLSLIPPTNCWTQFETSLAETLVACSSLLSFLGVADAAAARAGNMWYDSIGSADEEYSDTDWMQLFPQVIIGTPGGENAGFEIEGVATNTSNKRGVVEVRFAAPVEVTASTWATSWIKRMVDLQWPANTFTSLALPTEADVERTFKNAIGDILVEAENLNRLSATSWTVQDYGRMPVDDRIGIGDLHTCDVYVPWGASFGEAA